jgi:predicted amidohydrolase
VISDEQSEMNVARATEMVARASDAGVQLLLFPEGYPGPVLRRPHDSYDAEQSMAEAAKASHIAVCWSRIELCDDGLRRLVVYLVDEDGKRVLRYERAHPAAIPPEQTDAWLAPGNGLALAEIAGVKAGIVVCSELWVPEPTRVLALRGAELILSPAGGGFTTLTRNWQIIAQARAIENSAYVALTNNIWAEEVGAAMIAGPEGVIIESGHEDLLVATADLDRVRWLRSHDDSIEEPKAFSSIPGLLRFRRPELYEDLIKPVGDEYDFFHDPTELQPNA